MAGSAEAWGWLAVSWSNLQIKKVGEAGFELECEVMKFNTRAEIALRSDRLFIFTNCWLEMFSIHLLLIILKFWRPKNTNSRRERDESSEYLNEHCTFFWKKTHGHTQTLVASQHIYLGCFATQNTPENNRNNENLCAKNCKNSLKICVEVVGARLRQRQRDKRKRID